MILEKLPATTARTHILFLYHCMKFSEQKKQSRKIICIYYSANNNDKVINEYCCVVSNLPQITFYLLYVVVASYLAMWKLMKDSRLLRALVDSCVQEGLVILTMQCNKSVYLLNSAQ